MKKMYRKNFCFFVYFLYLIKTVKAKNVVKDRDEFDFIIVGGGTAGCVIARRLAESKKHTVLLIHEGGIPNPNLEVPALANIYTLAQNFPNDVKIYESVPQQNAGLETNGFMEFPIGKAMGGGSSVNSMMWNRGHPNDYNNWARLTNDSSWNYDNLLKYFRKTENYIGSNPTIQRGYNGPITISNLQDTPALKDLLQAGVEIGYPIGDPNGPQTPSINLIDFSINREGRRVSAYSGYIKPLLESGADNLFVLLKTEVKRVNFQGNKAVSVNYSVSNSSAPRCAIARKEIIISAGAIDSPAILMRSGVGPEEILKQAKIPVIKNLPVGRNLQDHPTILLPVIYGNRSAALVPSDFSPEALKLYEETGRGPYSQYMGIGAQGFFLSSLQLTSLTNWPDIHFIPQGLAVNSTFVDDLKDWEVIVNWGLLGVRPKSRGMVTLNPDNVDGPPLINFQYLTHPDDMKMMLDAVKISEMICEHTSAMKSLGCRQHSKAIPLCSHFQFRSEAYWKCYIQQRSLSGIHACGTCRMGSGPEDPEAVVDSQLKVIGIEGLSVADASVIVTLPNANTQAPVYVIGEKAADIILKQWGT